MAYINDEVFDQGLDYADTNGTRVDLCSQEPVTYTEATSTYTLCNKTGVNTGAPEDGGSAGGRRVVIPEITDGDVTGTGAATHWALTNGSNTLVATGALLAPKSFTSGNKFRLEAIDIVIYDAMDVAPDTWPSFPSLDNMLGRWRANEGVTLSGSNVTAVADQSGNSQDLSNGGTVPWSATAFNGKPGFAFANANSAYLTRPSFAMGTPASYTIVVAGQISSGANAYAGLVAYAGTGEVDLTATGGFLTGRNASNEAVWFIVQSAGGDIAITYDTPFWAVFRNQSGSDGSVWVNGAEGTTFGALAALGNAKNLFIGSRHETDTSHFLEGVIGEVVIFGDALTDSEITTQLAAYFENVNGWGL